MSTDDPIILPEGGSRNILVTLAEAAALLHLKPAILQDWRYLNVGPPWVSLPPAEKNGKNAFVRYRLADIAATLARREGWRACDDPPALIDNTAWQNVILNQDEAAAYLAVYPMIMSIWRSIGRGPPWTSIPARCGPAGRTSARYRLSDLLALVDACLMRTARPERLRQGQPPGKPRDGHWVSPGTERSLYHDMEAHARWLERRRIGKEKAKAAWLERRPVLRAREGRPD